jgi:DNA adenine methylase
VGGGALFFGLAAEVERPGRWAVLSDLNPRLVRTYVAVRDQVDALVDRLREHEQANSRDHFEEMRAWNVDQIDDDVDVAAWFIYLNKTAYNGLYRVNRKGQFNAPWGRYDRPAICDAENLRACSRALQGAEVRCEGFESVLLRARPGDFVYFDPPYVPASDTASFTSYTAEGFDQAAQERLRDVALALKDRGVQVLLSNSDTETCRALYQPSFRQRTVLMPRAINSAAAGRGAVPELLVW